MTSPAAERNKAPIGEILLPVFKENQWTRILEVGSRWAQHAKYMTSQSPDLIWQTTDIPENLEELKECTKDSPLPESFALDVSQNGHWISAREFQPEVIFTANTFHIMGWESVHKFWKQISELKQSLQAVFVYGPFFENSVETAPSNLEFDQSLKERIPGGGIRWLHEVEELADQAGMTLTEAHSMPANNRLLYFQRQPLK